VSHYDDSQTPITQNVEQHNRSQEGVDGSSSTKKERVVKARNVSRLLLSVVLLILAAGSGLAREPQPTGRSEPVGVNTSSAADAPWFNIEVDTPNDTGQYTSVAIDPSRGRTYVSYYDATNQALRAAVDIGGDGTCGPNNSWLCVDMDWGADVGKYSSIAISPASGRVGIAYYDATNGNLKYGFCLHPDLADCYTHDVDKGIFPVSSTGLYASLKHSSTGTWYISYHFDNPTNVDALMIAYSVDTGAGNCGHSAWEGWYQCDTIQVGEGVGQYTSLAVDGAGNRHIAYYDGGNGDLWYATSGSGTNCGPGNTWLCYPVDAAHDVGQYASMYVDDGNRFHIAYYDATDDVLKYAVNVGSGGNCGLMGSAQCDEIDSMQTGYHPLGLSIAEDAAGYPIIAYQSEWGDLNVARPVDALDLPWGSGNCGPPHDLWPWLGTWYCETIDRYNWFVPARHGDFLSIALNSSGLATIAYYGFITSSDGNLMVSQQRLQVFLPLVMKNQ
jgi:hypothetical protein